MKRALTAFIKDMVEAKDHDAFLMIKPLPFKKEKCIFVTNLLS